MQTVTDPDRVLHQRQLREATYPAASLSVSLGQCSCCAHWIWSRAVRKTHSVQDTSNMTRIYPSPSRVHNGGGGVYTCTVGGKEGRGAVWEGSEGFRILWVVLGGSLAGRSGGVPGAAWPPRATARAFTHLVGQLLQQGAWGGGPGAARGAERHHGSQNESQTVSHLSARSTSQSGGQTWGKEEEKKGGRGGGVVSKTWTGVKRERQDRGRTERHSVRVQPADTVCKHRVRGIRQAKQNNTQHIHYVQKKDVKHGKPTSSGYACSVRVPTVFKSFNNS